MPTITVNKAELYRRLEKEYTTHEFDELCFDFGIELDEDVSCFHACPIKLMDRLLKMSRLLARRAAPPHRLN